VERNTLYYGDNLDVLRRHVKDESIDLVYLDPPLSSYATYNVLIQKRDDTPAPSPIEAFGDTWHWDQEAAETYRDVVEQGGRVADALQALRTFIPESDMLAYLAMMAPRLVELHRTLKDTGAIYLHCNPTASHYFKMLLDAVFGREQFGNEIIWRRHAVSVTPVGRYRRVHDVILYYAKGAKPVWNKPRDPLDTARETRLFPSKNDFAASMRYMEEGDVPTEDVWADIDALRSWHAERLGHSTQKPVALLERIVRASSNEGDTVLDPFCGCGTTIAAAQSLGRKWIGIDLTHLAIGLIKVRLQDAHGLVAGTDYAVVGEPTDLPGAWELAAENPSQFQAWALGLVSARTATSAKKGSDKGIDGRILFHDESGAGTKTKQIILSLKAGGTNVGHVRDLIGVLQREGAQIGVLLTMHEPTQAMRAEAAGAGFYKSPWVGTFPRVQLITVADALNGKRIEYPVEYPTHITNTIEEAPHVEEDEYLSHMPHTFKDAPQVEEA
jgi:site-specific DNA-methyltransferase (adenine-specific)